jgi:hypothetical protein
MQDKYTGERRVRMKKIKKAAGAVLLGLFWSVLVFAQPKNQWIDIELIETPDYTAVSRSQAGNPDYPPSNLFDADYDTCWATDSESENKNPRIFIRMPEDAVILNIYSGYGKSSGLYHKNARPRTVKISLWGGINPEGYVSEKAALYKALRYEDVRICSLKDENGLQHIPLDFPEDSLKNFMEECRAQFTSDFNMPIAGSGLILELEITDIIEGTEYDDICISEIFFNDRFMSGDGRKSPEIRNVYINEKENTLLAETRGGEVITIYRDTSAVLQLLEVSKNKRWATIISMPAEIQGRAETTYLLVDLINRRTVNEELAQATGDYLPGNEMFLDCDQDNGLVLSYISADKKNVEIELKKPD